VKAAIPLGNQEEVGLRQSFVENPDISYLLIETTLPDGLFGKSGQHIDYLGFPVV
jgi:hypothetical protein